MLYAAVEVVNLYPGLDYISCVNGFPLTMLPTLSVAQTA